MDEDTAYETGVILEWSHLSPLMSYDPAPVYDGFEFPNIVGYLLYRLIHYTENGMIISTPLILSARSEYDALSVISLMDEYYQSKLGKMDRPKLFGLLQSWIDEYHDALLEVSDNFCGELLKYEYDLTLKYRDDQMERDSFCYSLFLEKRLIEKSINRIREKYNREITLEQLESNYLNDQCSAVARRLRAFVDYISIPRVEFTAVITKEMIIEMDLKEKKRKKEEERIKREKEERRVKKSNKAKMEYNRQFDQEKLRIGEEKEREERREKVFREAEMMGDIGESDYEELLNLSVSYLSRSDRNVSRDRDENIRFTDLIEKFERQKYNFWLSGENPRSSSFKNYDSWTAKTSPEKVAIEVVKRFLISPTAKIEDKILEEVQCRYDDVLNYEKMEMKPKCNYNDFTRDEEMLIKFFLNRRFLISLLDLKRRIHLLDVLLSQKSNTEKEEIEKKRDELLSELESWKDRGIDPWDELNEASENYDWSELFIPVETLMEEEYKFRKGLKNPGEEVKKYISPGTSEQDSEEEKSKDDYERDRQFENIKKGVKNSQPTSESHHEGETRRKLEGTDQSMFGYNNKEEVREIEPARDRRITLEMVGYLFPETSKSNFKKTILFPSRRDKIKGSLLKEFGREITLRKDGDVLKHGVVIQDGVDTFIASLVYYKERFDIEIEEKISDLTTEVILRAMIYSVVLFTDWLDIPGKKQNGENICLVGKEEIYHSAISLLDPKDELTISKDGNVSNAPLLSFLKKGEYKNLPIEITEPEYLSYVVGELEGLNYSSTTKILSNEYLF